MDEDFEEEKKLRRNINKNKWKRKNKIKENVDVKLLQNEGGKR